MRDGADRILRRVFESAGAVARPGGIVSQVAGEDSTVSRKREVFGG